MANVNFSADEFMEENPSFILEKTEEIVNIIIEQLDSSYSKEVAQTNKTMIIDSSRVMMKYVVKDIISEIENLEEE